MPEIDLPLRYATPKQWAVEVLRQLLALLNDHAHLEKKAASNALGLLNRWPEPSPPGNRVAAMTAIARDEVEHLTLITRLLARRGSRLTKQHTNPYAADLHKLVRKGRGPEELIDRLMISGLIEARSCERFYLLASSCDDEEFARIYENLWHSEQGHYRTFIQLAEQLLPVDVVSARWNEMLDAEVKLIQHQLTGPRMHSSTAR